MSFTGNPGPMQSQAFPVAHGSSGSVLDRLNPALALLSKREQFDPSDNMAKSFQSKSETFEERVVYLQVFFEGALFDTPNQFMTQTLFPFRMYDDINFGWEYWHFPSMPMVRTAQHAPPIKNTFQRKRGTATMSRYAMAVEGSSEADRTTTGQTITMGKLASMAHSANSMFELNGFRAIFKEPALMRKYFYEAQLYGVDMARKLAVELSHFDVLRREPLGFQNLTDSVQQEFSETMQVRATHAIISEGSRSIFAQSDMMQEYRKRGPGNQQFQDLQGDAPALQQQVAGVSLLVARRYYFDGAGFTVNPMQRQIQIGGFGIADNFNPSCDAEQYRTRMSEAAMFDVDANGGGGFQWLDTAWLVANNSRFNADGRLAAQHYELAKRNVKVANAYNLPLTDSRLDMFVYATPRADGGGVVFNVASHWGQMERWALMDHAVRNIAGTSAAAARRRIGEQNERAIVAGLEQIERIRRKALTAADVAFMRAAAPAPAGGLQAAGNKYGAHDLPDGAAVGGVVGTAYLPAGFGTFGGALTIGEAAGTSAAFNYIDQGVRDTFQRFLPAVKALFAAYREIYHRADPQMPERAQATHPALLAQYAPEYYKSASPDAREADEMNALLAFGYNVLTEVPLPVYLDGSSAAVQQPAAAPRPADAEELDGANDDIDGISDMLDEGAPLALQNAFSTNARATAFRARFEQSAFANAYQAHVDAARVRTRGTVPPGADKFARFYAREVLGQGRSGDALETSETLRLLARVVAFVNGGSAPEKITSALLRSYAGEDFQGAALASLSTTAGGALYLTRLSVPYERLVAGVQLASPLNSGAVLASADELARAAQQGDLARTVVFSGANSAGERRPLRRAPTAAGGARSALFGAPRGAPAFAADIGTDAVPGANGDTFRVTNKHLAERWAAANALADPLLRAAAKMLLAAPITRAVVCSFAANHIALPLAHIVARPHKRYATDAVVYLSVPERRPIAFTAVHDPRVNYIYNGITETYVVHLVLYTESVLTHGQSVLIVPDARVSGYNGGDNLVPFSAATYDAAKVRKLPRDSPSVIVMAMPSGSLHGPHRHVGRAQRTAAGSSVGGGEHLFGSVFDIRGRWGRAALGNKAGAQSSAALTAPTPAAGGNFAQYSSAFYYTYLFGFDKLKPPGVLPECRLKVAQEFDNTVVLQERQLVSVNGGGTPDAEIAGCDHFKDATENGCRGRRIGVDNAPYSTIYRPLPQLPA